MAPLEPGCEVEGGEKENSPEQPAAPSKESSRKASRPRFIRSTTVAVHNRELDRARRLNSSNCLPDQSLLLRECTSTDRVDRRRARRCVSQAFSRLPHSPCSCACCPSLVLFARCSVLDVYARHASRRVIQERGSCWCAAAKMRRQDAPPPFLFGLCTCMLSARGISSATGWRVRPAVGGCRPAGAVGGCFLPMGDGR